MKSREVSILMGGCVSVDALFQKGQCHVMPSCIRCSFKLQAKSWLLHKALEVQVLLVLVLTSLVSVLCGGGDGLPYFS